MKFQQLVRIAADLHCFSPGMLAAGQNINQVRVQLSRWVASGRVVRIHKGWYTLNEPFRRVRIDTQVVASTIKEGSYVSLHSALEYHGLIPEYVAETTCVTTGRPLTIDSPFGRIRYRHIKRDAFFGYLRVENGLQQAYVAKPEKAVLDLLYLTPGSEDRAYLNELRLQQTHILDVDTLQGMAVRFHAPRLERAGDLIQQLIGGGAHCA